MRHRLSVACLIALLLGGVLIAQQQRPSTSNTADMRIWGLDANGTWVPVVLDASNKLPTSTSGGIGAATTQQRLPSTSETVDARLWAKDANGFYVPVVLDASGRLPTAGGGGGGCTGYTGNIEVGLNTLHFVDGCLSTVD